MKTRGEGQKTATGGEKTGGRLRLLEQFVHMERLPMSNEWVVKLGNKNGAQIDIASRPTKTEAANLTHFVGQIVLEIAAQVAPEGINHLVTLTKTAGIDYEETPEWQRP